MTSEGVASTLASPFLLGSFETKIMVEADAIRDGFDRCPALLLHNVIDPALLDILVARAAAAAFVHDDVEHIGTRQVEAPQHVGGMINMLLGRQPLFAWLQQVTDCGPLRSVEGRLVQTLDNGRDALAWHDDMSDTARRLAIVINFSTNHYEGGMFEMRRVGEAEPFLVHRHEQPGSMLLFAVRSGIEHRVTTIAEGGPRRVYAGWFLA